MSKIWFCSDHHFNHNRDFIYKERGFETVYDMNEAIVSRHNALVDKEDTVYFLGDVIMGAVTKDAAELVQNMNGHKILITGNHDTSVKIEKYKEYELFEEYNLVKLLQKGKKQIYLSHYPTLVGNGDEQRVINICGHNHFNSPYKHMEYNCYHVEMEAHDCCPTELEDILNDFRDYWTLKEVSKIGK